MESEVETVLAAVSTLYGKDHAAAAQANIWLDHFRKSVPLLPLTVLPEQAQGALQAEAWAVCERLLQVKRDGISTYFAAQTLRGKVAQDLRQLQRPAQVPIPPLPAPSP